MSGDLQQLHVSGLTLLAKCGIAYERRYLNRERTPTSVSAAIGTAVDASCNADLQSDIDRGELLPDEQVKDLARDVLEREWPEVHSNGQDEEEGLEYSKDKAIDRSVKLAAYHHGFVAPALHPTHVQRSWTLDVEGLDVQLAGTIDRQREFEWVRDLKTTAKSPKRDAVDTSLQLSMYALAVYAHDNPPDQPKRMVQKVGLDYIVMTPAKGLTRLVQIERTPTLQDFQPLLERVNQAAKTIQSGTFSPADPTAWWCSQKWCSYWSTCRYALRPVSVSVL